MQRKTAVQYILQGNGTKISDTQLGIEPLSDLREVGQSGRQPAKLTNKTNTSQRQSKDPILISSMRF
jgi:hypothetical protein